MKFTSTLLPLLALASGLTATPVPAEESSILEARAVAGPTTFKITNFYNYGRPHSAVAHMGFSWESASGAKANCSASKTGQIATTPMYTRCTKPGVGFGFDRILTGYLFTVTFRYNRDKNIDTAAFYIPDQHVKRTNNTANPNANYYYIDYPANFTLAANPFVVNATHGPVLT
ncbi:hypothetical protein TWF718_010193 [Orbilia javanica]|uniref:Uncharacterized protein n=1 Tax=Orbilia javanica TaxID=47235 RepID=A0AAN8MNZ0_9PEZI